MSSSSNILLNEAALHSLKRSQLTRLCKRHGIKPVGKNVDLVARLHEHGQNAPQGSTMSDAEDSTDGDVNALDSQNEAGGVEQEDKQRPPSVFFPPQPVVPSAISGGPRSSEAWSFIDEPSGMDMAVTMKEFGGGSRSKSPSMSSSLKAFAGLIMHGGSASSKHRKNDVAVALPTPTTTAPPIVQPEQHPSDHEATPEPEFDMSISTIVRKDMVDAAGGKETVRLISSNQRDSYTSLWDYPPPFTGQSVIPQPSSSGPSAMASNSTPDLDVFNPSSTSSEASLRSPSSGLFPGAFSFSVNPALSSPPPNAISGTFTFRSPLPGKSSAAASVLEEMNRRMAMEGNDGAAITDFQSLLGTKRAREDDTDASSMGARSGISARFAEAHQKEFDKMPSIADLHAARRARAAALNVTSPRLSAKARSSSGLRPRSSVSSSATRRSVVRAKIRPSDLKAANADADGAGDGERSAKRARTSLFVPPGESPIDGDDVFLDAQPEQAESTTPVKPPVDKPATPREDKTITNVAISNDARRKVEAAKAATAKRKSRSSMGRQSIGRGAVLGSGATVQAKPKSRFGFLKSSAKLVKSVVTTVVGGSASAPQQSSTESRLPQPSTSTPVPSKKSSTVPNSLASKSSKTPSVFSKQPSTIPKIRKSTISYPTSRPVGTPTRTSMAPGASSLSRVSQLPSATSNPPTDDSTRSSRTTASSLASRASTLMSTTSTARSYGSGTTAVSSIGMNTKRTSKIGGTTSSSFYAPTASSLARMRAPSGSLARANTMGVNTLSSVQEQPAAAMKRSLSATPGTPNKFGFRGTAASARLKSASSTITSPSFYAPSPSTARGAKSNRMIASLNATTPVQSPSVSKARMTTTPRAFFFTTEDFATRIPRATPTGGTPAGTTKSSATPSKMAKPSTPVKSPLTSTSGSSALVAPSSPPPSTDSPSAPPSVRPRVPTITRRPRISRSKVIAKLSEQRAAAAVEGMSSPSKRRAERQASHKIRSSLSEQIRTRRSLAPSSSGSGGGGGKEQMARESLYKMQRQSEVAARRSRVTGGMRTSVGVGVVSPVARKGRRSVRVGVRPASMHVSPTKGGNDSYEV